MTNSKVIQLFNSTNVDKINSTTKNFFEQINQWLTPLLTIGLLTLLISSAALVFMMGIRPGDAEKYKNKLKYTLISSLILAIIVVVAMPLLASQLIPGWGSN
ncbi:hypothetical protein [Mesomycoplasma lagogenitalium]|uniref:Uncharacterized protein n=1 Tax=Mesomycoplasma lagogenitalium TaxID=171286 RepID=A0ABY8LUK6_9BACT|nr:hypothetical protein [Mesomycoplasma lagogenitalium]WGI36923.1 hypothetical protein QEG99_01415 [Mesomycoplasma lagogenitalium]